MSMRRFSLLVLLLTTSPTLAQTSAEKVQAILDKHCHRCHGDNGNVEGGLNYVVDLPRLVARKKVVPGKAADSAIWKRIESGTMPPPDVKDRLSDAEKATIRSWINDGAPLPSIGKREHVSTANVLDWALADLEKIDRRSRRFQRYISIAHLHNAGLAADELRTYRNAISKLINSLSWHPRVRNPEPIDPANTVFRIDLRWYMWDATIWNRMLQDYPYGVLDDGMTSRVVSVFTATKVPIIRGDWFVATASRPPLYQDILQLPGNLAELERQLRVDANTNITQERVMRVAFNGSGISRNNRVLERHDSVHGYYWRTYDFEEVPQNLVDRGLQAPDRRNVFAYPLGPGTIENTFQHAGGEAIFSLPNGLQGYYIMNAANNRIDKAPTAIVADQRRPDKAVELGVSCMGCHIPGVLSKADQMREHLEKSPKAVPRADAEIAMALYPPKEKSLAQMEEDARRFQVALTQTGTSVTRYEPIITMTLRYEGDLDAQTAAAEAGLPTEEFLRRVGEIDSLGRQLGSLRANGGTVARTVWVQAFGDLVRELRLGALFQASQIGASLPDNTGEVDPLEASAGQANQIVFTPDGRRALIASADRSVRLVEVEGKRDLKRFIGHRASVWAVALSSDSKQAISGGMDGTVQLWDVARGELTRSFLGHTGLVTAVAFLPDRRVISGGLDGFVIVWDQDTGKEVRRWRGSMKYVTAIATLPDQDVVAIAADRTVRLWDTESGKQVKSLEGHSAPVTAAAFSEDGSRLITGSDDRTINIWTIKDGNVQSTLKGHEGPIRSVAFSANGKWALSASADSTAKLWDLRNGKDVATFHKHEAAVVHAAFAGTGAQTVSGDRAGNVLIWNIGRYMNKK